MLLNAFLFTNNGQAVKVSASGSGMIRLGLTSEHAFYMTIREAESLRDGLDAALQEIETDELKEREWREEQATNQMG